MQSVCDAIEGPVQPSEIDVIHRVPTMSKNKNEKNIARFVSRGKKNDFVKKARKPRLNTKDIGFSGEAQVPVFVNDYLTSENKKLFSKALELKKEFSWRFFWTDNCRIKARKTEDSKVYRTATENDLRLFK